MRKTLWIFGVLVWGAVSTLAEAQTNGLAGNLGTSWMKILPSTRDAGMGDSAVAVPDAYDEVDLNPAGLGLMGGSYVSLSQNFWAQGLSAEHLVFSEGSSSGDGFSLGVNYMNFGSISTYNMSGTTAFTQTGSYSPMGFNLYAGYGLGLFRGLRAGLEGHFIYDDIQQNFPDQTASLDAGLFYQRLGFSLSALMSNLGWNIDSSTLPLEVKTAAAFQFPFKADNSKAPHRLTLSGEADWFLNNTNYSQYGLGMEYWFKNSVALRAGYQFSNIGDLTGLTGLSLGAGIKYDDWQLDYALITLGELGIANQIGLSLKVGENEQPTDTPTPSPTPSPTPNLLEAPPPITEYMPLTVPQALSSATPVPTPIPVTAVQAVSPVATPILIVPTLMPTPMAAQKISFKPHGRLSLRGPHGPDILSVFALHFDTGLIDLEAGDREMALNVLVKKLKEYPKFKFIFIAGYADLQKIKPTAPYKTNWELSKLRAEAFKKYLVGNGFDPDLIVTRGYGTNPSGLEPNSEEKHFNNRRIEVFIYF